MASLPIIDLLHQHFPKTCGFSSNMVAGAALSGDVELAKLLRERGYQWTPYACSWAARVGDLKMLMFLIDSGCPWGGMCWQYAGQHPNNLEVLQYMLDGGVEKRYSAWELAIKHERLKNLAFFHKHSFPTNNKAPTLCRMEVSLQSSS